MPSYPCCPYVRTCCILIVDCEYLRWKPRRVSSSRLHSPTVGGAVRGELRTDGQGHLPDCLLSLSNVDEDAVAPPPEKPESTTVEVLSASESCNPIAIITHTISLTAPFPPFPD